MQRAGDVHIPDAAPGMHHRGLMRRGELSLVRSFAVVWMLFRNFHFCSLLLVELRFGFAWVPPGNLPYPPRTSRSLLLTGVAMGSGQREPCFVRRSTPVPSFPLLLAAEGHKKNRVGVSPWEMMRSKCFLGSSLFLFWFVLFYFISLLPLLSRKPLLPHLQGICFTQRAPGDKSKKQTQRQLAGAGAWEIPCRLCCWTAASGRDLGAAVHGEGQEGRLGQGAALLGWRCNAQRPGERGKKGLGGVGGGSFHPPATARLGVSFPPEGWVVIFKFCLCLPFRL